MSLRTSLLLPLAAAFAGIAVPASAAERVDARLLALDAAGDDYAELRDAALFDLSLSDGDLATIAASHPDRDVRRAAETLLGWRDWPEIMEAVWAAEPVPRRDGMPRFVGAWLGDERAWPAVVERLRHGDESPAERAALVAVLPGLREGWDAELAAMLGEESDPTLRQAVTWTLRHAGAEAGLAGLRVALQDPAANVRAEAARSLGWRSDGAELQVELRQALFDAEANVRAMAARSLGWRGVTLAAGEISGLVADADADVRLHALRALRRLDLPRARALPALGRLLADPDPRVARVARSVTAN